MKSRKEAWSLAGEQETRSVRVSLRREDAEESKWRRKIVVI
jgi:hypothetical protein